MFILEDGREHLFQWDLNRRLIVEDPTIAEVHFCNRTDDCSLVVETYTEDDKVYANIPNILLQDRWNIRAYAYCTDCYTKVEKIFEVKARTRPSDYAYTETEIKSYEYLEAKLTEIEEKGFSEETIHDGVTWYFTENPTRFTDDGEGNVEIKLAEGELDLDDYATKQYVDEAIAEIDVPEADLSNYYTKAETDALIENVEVDLTGYATETYVNDAIAAIDIPETDLTGYATEQWVEDKGYLTEHQSLEAYAKKTDIPDVSGFITEIPAEYITETELEAKGYLTEHQSLEGYATEQYVDEAIAAIDIPEADLTNYYTKEEVDALFEGIATAEGGAY